MLAERLDGDAREQARPGRHFDRRIIGGLVGFAAAQKAHALTLHRNG
jgi:hypothetical protein